MSQKGKGVFRMIYPVKLITGVLYPDEWWWQWVLQALSPIWGEPERISDAFPFDKTDYYHDIAPVLYRRFISFPGLRNGDELVRWKKESGLVEQRSSLAREERDIRAVNIDPGYINGARLVLASTKDHAHRIYLTEGIFAEVTMRYRFKQWVAFDYTFPDFASGRYNPFLSAVREDWHRDMAMRRHEE
jgi:hypothetical protein